MYIWHLEIFWLSDKVMYMKVLVHPILLEKQLDTIFLKKPPRTSAGAKWWLQKGAGGVGLFSGYTWSNFPKTECGSDFISHL